MSTLPTDPILSCEESLAFEKKYFVGNFFSIADISVFTCLEYLDLRFPKFKWRDKYQNLVSYWEIHQNRQSFVETKLVAKIIESLDD